MKVGPLAGATENQTTDNNFIACAILQMEQIKT
jgi:hypothetical protein